MTNHSGRAVALAMTLALVLLTGCSGGDNSPEHQAYERYAEELGVDLDARDYPPSDTAENSCEKLRARPDIVEQYRNTVERALYVGAVLRAYCPRSLGPFTRNLGPANPAVSKMHDAGWPV